MDCEKIVIVLYALKQLLLVFANLGALDDFEVNSILWPHSNPNSNLQGHLQTIKKNLISFSNSMIATGNLQKSAAVLFGTASS